MHTDIKKDIGNKIKQLRTVIGLSREQVADKLKMSASNYGNIERGAADISITRLIDIAVIFEIILYDLLGLNEKKRFLILQEPQLQLILLGLIQHQIMLLM